MTPVGNMHAANAGQGFHERGTEIPPTHSLMWEGTFSKTLSLGGVGNHSQAIFRGSASLWLHQVCHILYCMPWELRNSSRFKGIGEFKLLSGLLYVMV